MKVYKENNQFFMKDNGNIVELTPNQDYYLRLPANSVNRQWVSCAKIDKAPNQCIDYGEDVKVARTNIQTSPRKGLEEYLEGEEKELFLQLIEKAKKNREEANKTPKLTDIEKKQRLVNKYLAEIEALKAQQNNEVK